MLLKNLMEDKQLNLNQPLLSVRRFSGAGKGDKEKHDNFIPGIPRLPQYRSDIKSGPVRNAGAVPFQWEQSPGRPKEEKKSETRTAEKPPLAPKFPPGRIPKPDQQDHGKAAESPTAKKTQLANVPHSVWRIPSPDDYHEDADSFQDTANERENTDSDDDDEEYVDAPDTLSRSESFFLNCSVSGLSGMEEPERKPSGTFSTDQQTRDFMIGRFLPAAKAMASEVPQYAPRKQQLIRKQPVDQDQPRPVKKLVNGNKQPLLRYGPSFTQRYAEPHAIKEQESDEEYDEHEILPSKVCGLLPRFCLKSSFCLLNPVPGMSVRTRMPISRVYRTQARSSSADSSSETENEQSTSGISDQKSVDESQMIQAHEFGSDRRNESFKITHDSQPDGGSSLQRCLLASQNEPSDSLSKKVPFGTTKDEYFDSVDGSKYHDNACKRFQEFLDDQSSPAEADLGSPTIEKTLYVDAVHKLESISIELCSSDGNGLSDVSKNEGKPSEDSLFLHCQKPDTMEVGLKLESQKSEDAIALSPFEKSKLEMEIKIQKAGGNFHQDLTIMALPKVKADEKPEKQPAKPENAGNFPHSRFEFPGAPPLPKSPSDSWLSRTLPSMSSKNSALRTYLSASDPQIPNHKAQAAEPKWETIVKKTKVQNQHLRYSEELMALTPIPEAQ